MKHLNKEQINRTPKLLQDILDYLENLDNEKDNSIKLAQLKARIRRQLLVLSGQLIN